MLPWTVIAALQGNYPLAIGLLIVYLIVTIIRNIIEPKINIDENGVITAIETGTIVVTATAKSGVTETVEIEVYSSAGDVAAGIIGLAALGGGGTALYYRRKKKKSEVA